MILGWVNDIWEGVTSFVTGMRTTARFFTENVRGQGGGAAVTRQYPQQPAQVVGERVRGHLFNEAKICIVCHACDKVCPVDCFSMEGERDENNKIRASRFDIDLSKCIYCGLCVRACPTDSLSMTTAFELDPHREDVGRYLFTRNASQLEQRLDAPTVERLTALANRPREELTTEERAFVDAHLDTQGRHLIGMYGLGYYTPEQKAAADAEREAKKKAKDAAAAAAKAKAAAATPPPAAAPAPAPKVEPKPAAGPEAPAS